MSAEHPVVAVVTAKGRSRRAPGKNLRLLAGRPLFAHSVRLAQACPRIDRVLVTSDSEEILGITAALGAEPRPRPAALATDTATSFAVLEHLVAELRAEGTDPDVLVLIQPTTPFCTPAPLDAMVARLEADRSADSLITVVRTTRPVGEIRDGLWHSRDAIDVLMKNPRVEHILTGHVFMMRPATTLDRGTLLGARVLPADLPEDWLDVDIDTEADWAIAADLAPRYFAGRPG